MEDKLLVGGGSVILEAHSGTFLLPTVAQTTLTTTAVNTLVNHYIPSLTGSDVTGFITNTVSGGRGRITFPKAGFVTLLVEGFITIHSTTIGTSGSVGHLVFEADWYSSTGTKKDGFVSSEAIHDASSLAYRDPVSICAGLIPVMANDYIEFKIGFETNVANKNIRISIPAATDSQRENVDVFFYDRMEVEDWAKKNNATLIPANKLPSTGGGGLTQSQVDARVRAGVSDWAEQANTDPIPANKLTNAPSSGGGLNQSQVDARVRAGTLDWAETGNTDPIPANKLTNAPSSGGGLSQAQVDLRVQEGTEEWAHKGNSDQIPKNKLKNAAVKESISDFDFNSSLILRDFSEDGYATSIVLPTNYATAYRYLIFGTHVNAEYGIFDTKYLNAQPGATFSDESGTYTFTKATRTLSGQIKGAYLYAVDSDNIYEEDGWLRSVRNNQNQLTTNANDGLGGFDLSKATVDKYEYFAFRVWGGGTLQFLPKAVYDDIASGGNRVFLVWDEANTKTLKVSLAAGDYGFNAFNKSTNSEINEMRSMAFLNFAKENVLLNDKTATDTTLTLPEGYTNSDLLIAVTKNAADDFYKIWTIRTKFTDAPNNRITENTRVFNPAASIIYASLINIHSKFELDADEVTTDTSKFRNVLKDTDNNVQKALETLEYAATPKVDVNTEEVLQALPAINASGGGTSIVLPTNFKESHLLRIYVTNDALGHHCENIVIRALDVPQANESTEWSFEGWRWTESTRTLRNTDSGKKIKFASLVKFRKDLYTENYLRFVRAGVWGNAGFTRNGRAGNLLPNPTDYDYLLPIINHPVTTIGTLGETRPLPIPFINRLPTADALKFNWMGSIIVATQTSAVYPNDAVQFNSLDSSSRNTNASFGCLAFKAFKKLNLYNNASNTTTRTFTHASSVNLEDYDALIVISGSSGTITRSGVYSREYIIGQIIEGSTTIDSLSYNSGTRTFTATQPVRYAELVKYTGEHVNFEIPQPESVDLSSVNTPKRGRELPADTLSKEGDEFMLEADQEVKGPDIQTESFSDTFLDGENWGSFGWCSYHDTQGQLFNLGHNSEPLPDGVLIISNKNIVVMDGTNANLTAIVVEDKDGTKYPRKLTFTNRNNYKITGSDHAINVDSYTYNADLPAGPWHNVYFLTSASGGTRETVNVDSERNYVANYNPTGWLRVGLYGPQSSTFDGEDGNPTLLPYSRDGNAFYSREEAIRILLKAGLGLTDNQIYIDPDYNVQWYWIQFQIATSISSRRSERWTGTGVILWSTGNISGSLVRISKIAFRDLRNGGKMSTYKLDETVAGPITNPISVTDALKRTAYIKDTTDTTFQSSEALTGRVTDAVVKKAGVYRRKDALWQPQNYDAPLADIDKPLTFAVQETLPGAPQGKSVPFVLTNNVYATQNPFDGINNVFYDPRSSGDTAKRWGVRIPPQTPDEEYPTSINFDGSILSLHFLQTDSSGGLFVTNSTGTTTSDQLSSAISKPINIELANGLWLGQSGEKKINRTLDKDGISTVARRIPRLTNLPAVEYGIAGQMFYLLETKTVRGVGILTPEENSNGLYIGYFSSQTSGYGSINPSNNKLSWLSTFTNQIHKNKIVVSRSSASVAAFTMFWFNGHEYGFISSPFTNGYFVDNLTLGRTIKVGQEYAFNIKQASGWIYPDVTLPKDKYYIWNGYQFIETHLAMKDYASRDSSEKIPKDDFSTTLTRAQWTALSTANKRANHVYYITS